MSAVKRILIAALLPGSLAACATDPPAAVPAGALRLQAEDIRALLAQPVRFDNGVSGGLSYAFAPDGTVAYSMRMLPVSKAGRWRVDADGLCIVVDRDDSWECGPLYRLGPTQYYFDLPGYGASYNTLNRRP